MFFCSDLQNHILKFLHPDETKLVSKKYYDEYKKKLTSSISFIKKCYTYKKLYGDTPYNFTTLNTLKRFYVTKYRPEWLQEFPISYCRILIHLGANPTDPNIVKYMEPSAEQQRGFVKNFLDFVEEYNLTQEDLDSMGW